MLYGAAALALLAAAYLFWVWPRLPRRDMGPFLGHDYAHRGLWNTSFPENSLPAFHAAAEGGFGIETVILNTYYFIGKMLAAQLDGHRAANKAESYNCYFHNTFLILSKASSNTPGSAQSEMRRYSRPFLPKMNPGVMNTPASSSSLSETASASAPLFPQRKSP